MLAAWMMVAFMYQDGVRRTGQAGLWRHDSAGFIQFCGLTECHKFIVHLIRCLSGESTTGSPIIGLGFKHEAPKPNQLAIASCNALMQVTVGPGIIDNR